MTKKCNFSARIQGKQILEGLHTADFLAFCTFAKEGNRIMSFEVFTEKFKSNSNVVSQRFNDYSSKKAKQNTSQNTFKVNSSFTVPCMLLNFINSRASSDLINIALSTVKDSMQYDLAGEMAKPRARGRRQCGGNHDKPKALSTCSKKTPLLRLFSSIWPLSCLLLIFADGRLLLV